MDVGTVGREREMLTIFAERDGVIGLFKKVKQTVKTNERVAVINSSGSGSVSILSTIGGKVVTLHVSNGDQVIAGAKVSVYTLHFPPLPFFFRCSSSLLLNTNRFRIPRR